MSASWPSAKKTFSQVVNGVTKLVALLFNANYDETEALQTFIGASGETQAKNSALNNLFRDMLDPAIRLTWIDADTMEIEAKTVVMHNGNDYVIKRNTSTIQITLSGDLDTGSEAASTWYDVCLIGDGSDTTYTAKFVLTGNNPSGATYFKRIGKCYNDSGSDITKESIQTIREDKPFGGWETKSDNTVYQAPTDGFGCGYINVAGNYIDFLTDASNPPTTYRERDHSHTSVDRAGVCVPVRKGDYWKIGGTTIVAVYWLPAAK